MAKIRQWRLARWSGICGALFASALLAIMLGAPPAYASASSFTASVRFPIQTALMVSCANGGTGEVVVLSGTLRDLIHVTIDGRGGAHFKIHGSLDVRGVGLTTGAKYRGTGVFQSHYNFGAKGLPVTVTFVDNFRIIGQGSGNNFLVHGNFHVTVNANGTVTATVNNFRVACK